MVVVPWCAVLLLWSILAVAFDFRLGGEAQSCGCSDDTKYACLTVPAGTFNRAFSLYWTLEEGYWLRARAMASAAGAGSSGWLSLGEYLHFNSPILYIDGICLTASLTAALTCMQASVRMDEWRAVQLSLHCQMLA
jgi:hypothetical protein